MGIMALLHLAMYAQNSLSGRITDEHGEALAGATVFIPELNKGTISATDGSYRLGNLPAGKLKVQYSFVGYLNQVLTLEPEGREVVQDIQLELSVIEADEVVISGGYNSTQHENAVKIEVLKLDRHHPVITPNFMELITSVPGVDMISKGSGVAKPVIRGMSMNDVLVLNNGVRFENYQYSDHHPLGIDEFGIAAVEVIKGPASLLYGSDAIGGVINFIKEKPAPLGTVQGDYNLQLHSNTLGFTNNFGIKGATGKVFGGFRIGQKSGADFLQGGGGFAPNTRFNGYSLKSNAGFTGKNGIFNLYYDYSDQKLGLAEDEAIEATSTRGRKNELYYQELKTHLLSSQNKLYFGGFKLDLNSAFQNTELTHFGDPGVYELQMRLATLTYESRLFLPSGKQSEYIIGYQGMQQFNTNVNDRETILLPDAHTGSNGVYGLLMHNFFGQLRLQAGLRYDRKAIFTRAVGNSGDAAYREAIDKSYGSLSGSVGLTWNLTDRILFRANFASAYRTPNLAELTSNGQHELRYEIGDQDLVPEKAYETDLSFHYHGHNLTFDLAGFYNVVNHFIYISPTGDTTATGLSVYRYMQANALLYGGEADLHFHPVTVDWLHLEGSFSSVRGLQRSGDYLPFIPADKLKFEVRAEKEELGFFDDAYVFFKAVTTFAQDHPAPEEEATAGYTLFDAGIGGELLLGRQSVSWSLAVTNLLDKAYTDHLSTLQEVGIYNPGRNVSLSVKVPF